MHLQQQLRAVGYVTENREGTASLILFLARGARAMVAVMDTARRRATYEDLLKAPDILIAEIIDGESITSPRPAFPQARATSSIGQDLSPFDRRPGGPSGPGGWWILFESELHLGADVPVSDLAGWRRERMSVLADEPYSQLAPDWV